MTIHVLNIQPELYELIELGIKKFEVRLNDRNYQLHDTIRFRFLDVLKPFKQLYKITYIYYGLGLQDGFVVLGIEAIVGGE